MKVSLLKKIAFSKISNSHIYAPIVKILAVVGVMLMIDSCKLSDESKLKIAWHNLIARDNIWFNANEKIKETKATLRKQQEDKYDKILDVFTYGSEAQKKGTTTDMDESIKRAQKIMAKHYISHWMDDAYFIVGQAQYLKGDFYASVETFQYLITKYKKSPLRYESMLWICKNYLALKKTDDAESLAGLIKSDKTWPKYLYAEREALAAEVELKQEKYRPAAYRLRAAIQNLNFTQRYEKARYSFILAQVYQKLAQYDSANYFFKKCIKYNPPYEMAFYAKMNLAKAYNANKPSEARSIKRYLKNMLRDDKNVQYFDQIYYELGLIALREKNEVEAIKYFKLSAQSSKGNKDQKAKTYLALAEYYFNRKPKPDYKSAQTYFDSTAQFVTKENPDYDKILEKKSVLGELIKNLLIIEEEDSLLKMSSYPAAKIDKILDQVIEDKKAKKEQNENQPINNINNAITAPSSSGFYFSNPGLIASGQADFIRKYGDRKNTDYWRIASKAADFISGQTPQNTPEDSANESIEEENQNTQNSLYKNASNEKKRLLNKIPFTDKAKTESEGKIAEAMSNVGSIYNENLSDYDEAEEVLKNLMIRYPKYTKMDKVIYQLYKIKKEQKDEPEAERYKKMLIEKYPTSNYTKIVTNKKVDDRYTEVNKEILAYYEETYQLWLKNDFNQVKSRKQNAEKQYPNNGLMPKFDFLYALAVGKTDSLSKFENQLVIIENKYQNTEESEKAHRILELIKKRKENKAEVDTAKEEKKEEKDKQVKQKAEYKSQYSSRFYYILLVPIQGVNTEDLKNRLSDLNQLNYVFENLDVKSMFLDSTYQLIRVVEFKDKQTVKKYVDDVNTRKNMFEEMGISDYRHFGISEDNFLILYNTKDWESYIDFYSKRF
ncbi:MAG: hypothetical protein HYZ42_04575 [Bacteroidetes bacterium]|nr:hypothetical protein [Bacteroidota bacterium]